MRRITATAVIGLLVLTTPAAAQTRTEHWNRCVNFQLPDETDEGNEKPEEALASCSWLLQSGDLTDDEKTAAYSGRGAVFLALKDYNAARIDLTEAITIGRFPDQSRLAWTHYNRARAYAALDRLREALPDLDTALRVEPTASRYEARGNLRDALGDTAGALGDWDYAMLLRPARVIPRYCQRQLERGESAVAADRYLDAIRAFDGAMRCPATAGRGLLRRGVTHRLNGAPTRSLEDLDKAVAADHRPEVLIERAITLQRLDRRDDALEDLSAAIRIDARDARARWLRAAHYREQRQYDLALPDAVAALASAPRSAPALFEHGHAMMVKGDFAKAVAQFTDAMSIEPLPLARVYRGLAYLRLGDVPRASTDFETSLNQDRLSHWAAFYGRSAVKERNGDIAGAADAKRGAHAQGDYSEEELAAFGFGASIADLWRTCENLFLDNVKPTLDACTRLVESKQLSLSDMARVLTFRANALAWSDRKEEAMDDLSRAIATSPSYTEAYYDRAFQYSQRKDHAAAAADYTKVVEAGARLPDALVKRGREYMHLKQVRLAIADFDAAVTKFKSVEAMAYRSLARQNVGDWKGADEDFLAASARHPGVAMTSWDYDMGLEPKTPPGVKPGPGKTPSESWLRCTFYRPQQIEACSALISAGTESPGRQTMLRRVRAAAYDRSQQHALAAADYTWLLERNEKDTGARFDRALAYIKAGDLKTASFDLDLLVQQAGDGGAHFLFARGVVRERTGDAAGAARDFAEAVKRDRAIEDYMRGRGITR